MIFVTYTTKSVAGEGDLCVDRLHARKEGVSDCLPIEGRREARRPGASLSPQVCLCCTCTVLEQGSAQAGETGAEAGKTGAEAGAGAGAGAEAGKSGAEGKNQVLPP
jgi:hypothetical protein